MSNDTRDGVSLVEVIDLNSKLTSADGQEWLTGLRKFLRKENPWPEVESDKSGSTTTVPEAPLDGPKWRRLGENVIEVNLNVPPEILDRNSHATVEFITIGKTGWVKVEAMNGKLYVDGVQVTIRQDADRGVHRRIVGHKPPGAPEHLHPNVIDALVENVHLIPESWKSTGSIIMARRVCLRSSGSHLVWGLTWQNTRWGKITVLLRQTHGYGDRTAYMLDEP